MSENMFDLALKLFSWLPSVFFAFQILKILKNKSLIHISSKLYYFLSIVFLILIAFGVLMGITSVTFLNLFNFSFVSISLILKIFFYKKTVA